MKPPHRDLSSYYKTQQKVSHLSHHALHACMQCIICRYVCTVCIVYARMHACGERWRGAPAAPWRGRWQLCACCRRTRERSGGDATRAQWRRRRGRARRTRCTWRAGGARGGVRVLLGAGHAPGGRTLSLLAAARGCASTLGPRLSAWQEPRAGRCAPSALPGGALASTRSRRTASARRQPRASRRLLGPRRRSWQPRPAARPRAQKVETASG